jgi:hypothetical protein
LVFPTVRFLSGFFASIVFVFRWQFRHRGGFPTPLSGMQALFVLKFQGDSPADPLLTVPQTTGDTR